MTVPRLCSQRSALPFRRNTPCFGTSLRPSLGGWLGADPLDELRALVDDARSGASKNSGFAIKMVLPPSNKPMVYLELTGEYCEWLVILMVMSI